MGRRGPPKQSAEWHRLRGTYRPDRHGPPPAPAEGEGAWPAELRMPHLVARPLDPIEEILQREGLPLPASSRHTEK
jgi:hypothetical protein